MNNSNGDMHDLRGGIPIIGGGPTSAKVGTSPVAFIRELDDDGTFTVPVINTAQGPRPAVPRDAFMDAEQLIEAIALAGGPVVQKPTLVSNLSRYQQDKDTFQRVGPNTYGLIEWDLGADELFGTHQELGPEEEAP